MIHCREQWWFCIEWYSCFSRSYIAWNDSVDHSCMTWVYMHDHINTYMHQLIKREVLPWIVCSHINGSIALHELHYVDKCPHIFSSRVMQLSLLRPLENMMSLYTRYLMMILLTHLLEFFLQKIINRGQSKEKIY